MSAVAEALVAHSETCLMMVGRGYDAERLINGDGVNVPLHSDALPDYALLDEFCRENGGVIYRPRPGGGLVLRVADEATAGLARLLL